MQRSSVSKYPGGPGQQLLPKEPANGKLLQRKSSEITLAHNLKAPKCFLTSNSVTNLPLIRFNKTIDATKQATDNKENQSEHFTTQIGTLLRSHSYTKDYVQIPSSVFNLANFQWSKTSNFLQKIELNKKKKWNRDLLYIPNQPVDSGMFIFFERKNFDKHIEKSYTLSKNTFMMMKINCNKIELPVTFKIKPDNVDIQVNVAFNDENCDFGFKFRATEFSVDTKTDEAIDNVVVKILAFKEQRFTIRTEFSMKSKLKRRGRDEADQRGGGQKSKAGRYRGYQEAVRKWK